MLNHPEPYGPASPPPAEDFLEINTSPPTEVEIRTAIKAMKSGKAPGVDSIHAEMLKADTERSTKILTNLFTTIWSKDTIPADWTKGLIVKLPKKGDLQNVNNWRGINLLSVPCKVFCRVLLLRIEAAIDSKLRQEQAGFRKGRGCIGQIFARRNIIEQCLEWNTLLFINFIDFKKAFGSVHRATLWKILYSYGVPAKTVTLIEKFYDHFECSVILDNKTLSEWFQVKPGVRQGCILSPILFLVITDWTMRKTTSDKPRRIQWNLFSHLEDLDFANDLTMLAINRYNLQEKTARLETYAKQTGLHINTAKTQVMYANATLTAPITANGDPLEFVDEFTYLGSLISKDNGAQKDIKARLGKARGPFARLQSIWKSKQYSLKTKVRQQCEVCPAVRFRVLACHQV